VAASTGKGYGIQTAARRTGLSPHTLRLWEQRYGALKVARSPAGRRRYSPADFERLRLLKRLVDSGERISRIADLADDELRNRLSELGLVPAAPAGRSLRVAAWGESLPARIAALALDLKLVATASSLEDFVAQCRRASPQIILIEADSLTARKLALILQLRRAMPEVALGIIFGFARRRDIEQLRSACDALCRAPADLLSVVEQLAGIASPAPAPADRPAAPAPPPTAPEAELPARRYSRRQLDFLATRSTSIDCECPAHLVQLVQTLLAFERYSAACAQQDADEAALHRMLLQVTARSRRDFEEALADVAAHEGISVPD